MRNAAVQSWQCTIQDSGTVAHFSVSSGLHTTLRGAGKVENGSSRCFTALAGLLPFFVGTTASAAAFSAFFDIAPLTNAALTEELALLPYSVAIALRLKLLLCCGG